METKKILVAALMLALIVVGCTKDLPTAPAEPAMRSHTVTYTVVIPGRRTIFAYRNLEDTNLYKIKDGFPLTRDTLWDNWTRGFVVRPGQVAQLVIDTVSGGPNFQAQARIDYDGTTMILMNVRGGQPADTISYKVP